MKVLLGIMTHGILGNARTVDVGLTLLRVIVGLAFMTIFEKFLPRDGVWGPQQWFIDDVANMGFPLPVLFAWLAVMSEFFGGLLLILGCATRYSALSNLFVTGVAAFVYHQADIGGSGLTAMVFFTMCATIMIAGPGRYSIDGLIARSRGDAEKSPSGGG
ncbi:MAG: DoxX family protein [Gemmatimonadetes bacterium]|nr:DoxX family protein [Gemmatimonadota bacterium]NNM07505.1 DoxX family protein [Gemmatimonadota bacterium]